MPTSTSHARVATAGEALIDMVLQGDGNYRPCAGGAVYNLARALAAQAVPTLYLNPLSQDRMGQWLRAGLQDLGIAMAQAAPVLEPTSLAMVAMDTAGKASYSFYREKVADRAITAEVLMHSTAPQAAPELVVVATGCLALMPEDQMHYLPWLRAERARGRCVVVDANLRPAVSKDGAAYRASVMAALQEAHIIKVSDDDLELLGLIAQDSAAHPASPPWAPALSAAQTLLRATTAPWLALTLGAHGAVLLSRSGASWHAQEVAPIQVVSTVGAGDCFLAGFIAALLADTNLLALTLATHTEPIGLEPTKAQQLLHRAIATASLCVQAVGCVPPSDELVRQRMQQVGIRVVPLEV